MTELASTMTPGEVASRAAHAIAVLNELTHGGGELSTPGDVRDIVASLELIGSSLPQLCEQLARFLVVQHEDGQLTPEAGLDADDCVTEVIEALAAAGQADVRGKAVTPFLLDYLQQATEGKSVEVNLDVARGNIALAGEIATAWSVKATGGAY